MNKNEIIEHLEGLAEYTADTMKVDDYAEDIWKQDTEALESAIIAVQMLYDILDNLDGQCIKGEMIAILSEVGYEPKDFEKLQICTTEEVQEYIDSYNN